MPIEVVKRYTRQEIQANPDKLYIFGDNYERQGMGGQAFAARGEPNAVGVRTKMKPTYGEDAFMTDENIVQNIKDILADFQPVVDALNMGKTVVWPEDGIGTGLANLRTHAPLTLEFINQFVQILTRTHGVKNEA